MSTPKTELFITPLSDETLGHCAEICQSAPDPWSASALERVKNDPNHWTFVAHTAAGDPVGFACFLAVAGSADLEILATAPAARRTGVARQLLQHALPLLAQNGVQRCLLEVRAGNAPAIALYQSLGFKTLALRPGMYQNPTEDGYLMARGLDVPPADTQEETP